MKNGNNKKRKIEEKAEFFFKTNHQSKIYNKLYKLKRNQYPTFKDSISQLYNKNQETNIIDNCLKNDITYDENNSIISQNKKSITLTKNLSPKNIEPRFKVKTSSILPQKFIQDKELSQLIEKINFHIYTESTIDFLETEEKIPQIEIDEIEKNKKSYYIPLSFPYNIILEIEKIYQEILQDFKGNGFRNLNYKAKVAANFINCILNKDYLIGEIFKKNKKIDKFLKRELCIFLCVLFIEEFNDFYENNIIEYKKCLNLSHINFLILVLLIITNSDSSKINIYSLKQYFSCVTLLTINKDRIDKNSFQNNFFSNSKEIKKILKNIIENLSNLNNNIYTLIKKIFLSESKKFSDIQIDLIKENNIILEKINKLSNDDNLFELNYTETQSDEEKENDLPIPSIPYLPSKNINDKREYTLVLDLDETLIHYIEENNICYVKVRMGTENFIRKISKYCEIVIFTASTSNYADYILDQFDCKNSIDFRLYRQHTKLIDNNSVKDLSLLNRDLSKIIIIDNIEENYMLQPMNGLNILDFEGDENDNELNYLLDDLNKVVSKKGIDVRVYLPEIRKKMLQRYSHIL